MKKPEAMVSTPMITRRVSVSESSAPTLLCFWPPVAVTRAAVASCARGGRGGHPGRSRAMEKRKRTSVDDGTGADDRGQGG